MKIAGLGDGCEDGRGEGHARKLRLELAGTVSVRARRSLHCVYDALQQKACRNAGLQASAESRVLVGFLNNTTFGGPSRGNLKSLVFEVSIEIFHWRLFLPGLTLA